MSINQLVDRTVPNRSDQLFANEYYTNLTRQEYVIRQTPDGVFEIRRTAPSAFAFRIGDAGYFTSLTYYPGWRTINAPIGVSWDAPANDTPYFRLGNRFWEIFYFDILVKTGKVTLKNQQSWPLEINSPADVILNAGSNVLFQIAGVSAGKIRNDKVFVLSRVDVGDYGGNFANYTPPAGEEGAMVVAVDTNNAAPGKRLYIFANDRWNYVNLT
jgi:hypothetical protein